MSTVVPLHTNSHSNLTMNIVRVTPKMAADWLSAALPNRTITAQRVAMYARDMKSGAWVLNPNGCILFDENGRLADGEHRLRAVVMADVAVDFIVWGNFPEANRGALDKGRPRSALDTSRLRGEEISSVVTSTARSVFLMLTPGMFGSEPVSQNDIDTVRDTFREGFEWAMGCRRKLKLTTAPYLAIMSIAFTGGIEVNEFHEGYVDGAGLTDDDPRLTLREWAYASVNRGSASIFDVALRASTALYHFNTGRPWPRCVASAQGFEWLVAAAGVQYNPNVLNMSIKGLRKRAQVRRHRSA